MASLYHLVTPYIHNRSPGSVYRLGIDEADDDYLEQLDEADWPTLIVPRLDDLADEFPASWYRALAGRVRWELNGFCWIEYEQP